MNNWRDVRRNYCNACGIPHAKIEPCGRNEPEEDYEQPIGEYPDLPPRPVYNNAAELIAYLLRIDKEQRDKGQ